MVQPTMWANKVTHEKVLVNEMPIIIIWTQPCVAAMSETQWQNVVSRPTVSIAYFVSDDTHNREPATATAVNRIER